MTTPIGSYIRGNDAAWHSGRRTVVPAAGTITHGRQITAANTGHTAYLDAGLGRNVQDSDLIVHTGLVSMSDFVGAGGTIAKHWFKGGIIADRDNVTYLACKFDSAIAGYYAGVHHPFTANWCSVDTIAAAGDEAIRFQDYTAYRCRLMGNSDGGKINGGCVLTECYVRVKGQDAADHNDGLQAVGSYAGNTILRCNIDARPVNSIGGQNSAIQIADSSSGLQIITDNWMAGGGFTLRIYENSTYNVQGNDFLSGSYLFGPVDRQVIPAGNVQWGTTSANRIVDAAGALVSVVAAP